MRKRIEKMEPAVGFEPTTDGLQNRCSTTELSWLGSPKILRDAFVATSNFNRKRPARVLLESAGVSGESKCCMMRTDGTMRPIGDRGEPPKEKQHRRIAFELMYASFFLCL